MGWTMADGVVAVQAFYIISGFYMALVLNEKYTFQGALTQFYASRALRLFPIYWVILLTTLLCATLIPSMNSGRLYLLLAAPDIIDGTSLVFVNLANVLLIGQDVLQFLHVEAGSFVWGPGPPGKLAANFLPVDQAWTLSLELMFYLFVPLLVRQTSFALVMITLLSMIARAFAYEGQNNFDPWTCRFFPFELMFFVLGILSYRAFVFLSGLKDLAGVTRLVGFALLVPACGLAIGYDFLRFVNFVVVPEGYISLRHWVYLGLVTVALPFIFSLTRHSKIDQKIGELSYPIYICHVLVLALTTKVFNVSGEYVGVAVLLGSVGLSAVLLYITAPITRLRRRKFTSCA